MIAPQRNHSGVEETRSRILAATREIFERNGTRGTTTREVAERAGVNEATLFRHFKSKAALIDAMRTDACGVAETRVLLESLSGVDIEADLRALAQNGVSKMLATRKLLCIALGEDVHLGDELPEWQGPKQILALLTDYFAARVAEGRLHGEPAILARVLMGMMFQLVVARKLWADVPDDGTVDVLIDVFLNGVKS